MRFLGISSEMSLPINGRMRGLSSFKALSAVADGTAPCEL